MANEPVKCPRCDGVGIVYSRSYFDGQAECLLCGGVGRVIPGDLDQDGKVRHYERIKHDGDNRQGD